jgi:hypothetical protein
LSIKLHIILFIETDHDSLAAWVAKHSQDAQLDTGQNKNQICGSIQSKSTKTQSVKQKTLGKLEINRILGILFLDFLDFGEF